MGCGSSSEQPKEAPTTAVPAAEATTEVTAEEGNFEAADTGETPAEEPKEAEPKPVSAIAMEGKVLTYEEKIEQAKAVAPKREKRRRRSSLKSSAEMHTDAQQAYHDPKVRFFSMVHFEEGATGQVPWTALRRAILHRWNVTAHVGAEFGMVPIYLQRETHLDDRRENILRAFLELPLRDYDFGSHTCNIRKTLSCNSQHENKTPTTQS
jgi:hypothetical protein